MCIEIIRRHIGRCHNNNPPLEQRRKQPPENHRVRYVGHGKLVEADQPRIACKLNCQGRDRITIAAIAIFRRCPVRMNPRMDIGHERMKMHTPFRLHRHSLIKQVHQHRFATSDGTPEIQSLHGRRPPN